MTALWLTLPVFANQHILSSQGKSLACGGLVLDLCWWVGLDYFVSPILYLSDIVVLTVDRGYNYNCLCGHSL